MLYTITRHTKQIQTHADFLVARLINKRCKKQKYSKGHYIFARLIVFNLLS